MEEEDVDFLLLEGEEKALEELEAELGIDEDYGDFPLIPVSSFRGNEDNEMEYKIMEEFNRRYASGGEVDDRNIQAIFVVKFDINEGNIVEFQYPTSMDLSGLEFKAMTSGAHEVDADIVYFKVEEYFGVACYSRRLVNPDIDRGAIMRSVGILMKNFVALHEHTLFLSSQVEAMNQAPGIFGPLKTHFQESQKSEGESYSLTSSTGILKQLKAGPSGYFPEFIQTFGPYTFAIWKAILLRKRILFFSPPPIKRACRFVYCSSLFSLTTIKRFRWDSNPLFYININDLRQVQQQTNFIACTTESILEKKFHLYDMYVKNRTIHLPTKEAQFPLAITEGDEIRYSCVDEILTGTSTSGEESLIKFFVALNNKLFGGLLVASERNETITPSDLPERFGLHKSDWLYLETLVDVLNLDILLVQDKFCGGLCSC